jgi:putative flavoprotein involved in K+ transport
MNKSTERYDTLVIGGGQAGLVTGYYLKQQGRAFAILDAEARVGDAWRKRWDTLRLFTPARYSQLPGLRFPGPAHAFPTKDQMADYLEAYAQRFNLPVQLGVRVDRLSRPADSFVIEAGERRFEAAQVVVAMSNWQKPRVPAFAQALDPGLVQLHSSQYRHPGQLRPGAVLLVGAGNSGAEIALEVAARHPTWLSGREAGSVPFDIDSLTARFVLIHLVLRGLFHRVMTLSTPIGRKARPKLLSHAMPLLRVKPRHLAAAGVLRVPPTVAVRDGRPVLEDGRELEVANVIWCTGFDAGFSWIDLPVHGPQEPLHERGIVKSVPGLYFVGLHFLYAASSGQIHGVPRDAEYIVRAIQAQARQPYAAASSAPQRPADGRAPRPTASR